jgi:putative FmdB family regulatory protein
MPTYSYKCTVCDTAFDIQQSFTDASLTECPTCQGKLRKLFSAVGVTFNGSGFYRNDSRASEKSSVKTSPAKKTEKAVSSSPAASSGASSSSGSTASAS